MTTGSCHCGAVTFEVEGAPDKALECNCSHCQRKGFLLWFVPRAQFHLTSGADALQEYLFHKHRIRHQFCKTCGVQGFAYGNMPDGSEMVAINVRACPDDVDIATLPRVAVDGKSF